MPKEQIFAIDTVDSVDRRNDIERSKWVQAAYLAEPTKIDPIYTSKINLNKLSQTTLENAPKVEVTADYSRPQIPEKLTKNPQKALGMEIALAIQRNEKLLRGMVDVLIKNIDTHNQMILKLNQEDEKVLNDLIDKLSKKENANTVKSILNVVAASTAITVGAILLAPETAIALSATAAGAALYTSASSIWACLLIASGVSNIAINEVMPRVGAFEKIASYFTSSNEDKKKLADNIQITASVANSIMGVISSIATAPIIGSVLNLGNGLKLFNTTVEVANGAANFKSEWNESELNLVQSNQTIVDKKLSDEQRYLENEFDKLHSATDIESAFNKISFNIFETLRKMQEINTR